MRELIGSSAALVARRFRYVAIISLGLALPGDVLLQAPAWLKTPLPAVGGGLSVVAAMALVAVLLADLKGPMPSTASASSIVRACLRCAGAYLVAGVLALPVAVAAAELSNYQKAVPSGVALELLLLPLWLFFIPILLAMPVCFNEIGGPAWALKRGWALSRPRRNQVRALLGGLFVAGILFGLLSYADGFVPLAAHITLSVAQAVVQAAFLAVLYDRLTAEEPPIVLAPALPRSPAVAAEGTFRASGDRATGRRPARR